MSIGLRRKPLKGSRQVVEALQERIAAKGLGDCVQLAGTFCMKNCQQGVSVTVGDELFSVSPDTVGDFFEKEILTRV